MLQIAADTLVLNDEYLFGHKRRAFIIEEHLFYEHWGENSWEVGNNSMIKRVPGDVQSN